MYTRSWTTNEDRELERLYVEERAPIQTIARALGRSVPSIKNRAHTRRLARPLSISRFLEDVTAELTPRQIAERHNVTVGYARRVRAQILKMV